MDNLEAQPISALQHTLFKHGVYFLTFCYGWYNDETCCIILSMYDQHLTLLLRAKQWGVDYCADHVSNDIAKNVDKWGGELATHAILHQNQIKIATDFRNENIMLVNVTTTEALEVGETISMQCGTEFIYATHMKDLLTARGIGVGPQSQFEHNLPQEPSLLDRLSCHPDDMVRLAVAQNPHTPHQSLEHLTGDLSPTVARAAFKCLSQFEGSGWTAGLQRAARTAHKLDLTARQQLDEYEPSTSQELLASLRHPHIRVNELQLINHFDWRIMLEVYLHPRATIATKQAVLKNLLEASWVVHIYLLNHQQSPFELLLALKKHCNIDWIEHPNWVDNWEDEKAEYDKFTG